MAIIKDVTVKINNGTATLDAPVQFYEKDHDVELRFRLMDYKYKYDKDPQNILNSVDEDVLEAYTTIVNPRGYELEQINGVVKNDVVIFRLDPTYTDELDELGTYKLQIHIKCTHSEFTIPPITFEVLQRLKGIKVVTDGEDEVDNSEILDNSSKFVSDETGKLIIEWKKGDMISSAKLNAMVDVINDAVDEEKIRQENEIEREKKANNKIHELENTRVEYVNKFDDELDSFADQVDTTMSDYETRFNALTVSQQQDAEIIDARDGEQTLRARLDRDIQKPSIIYEEVEDSCIKVDATCGYVRDIEIIGNTIQNQNDLADIRSVGDKLENQELYEIDVVNCGKNLFNIDLDFKNPKNLVVNRIDQGIEIKRTDNGAYQPIYFPVKIKSGTYYLSFKQTTDNILYFRFCSGGNQVLQVKNPGSITFDCDIDELVLLNEGVNVVIQITNIQIEEGTQPTPYKPYQEDKLTILSPVQLEKVGGVADRIICKDGVWGIEKNINKLILNGKENGWKNTTGYDNTTLKFYECKLSDSKTSKPLCNKYISNGLTPTSTEECVFIDTTWNSLCFKVSKEKYPTLKSFTESLTNLDTVVYYPTTQPTFIPLPHSQQIKLRTFAGQTNIHFETEIEGTIKAQVSKSLGATVNTHTEQIGNLSKELDRVKKLEESTASTVTTESNFTTVENTSNGYFENVKLEGKTLVNLAKTLNETHYRTNNGGSFLNNEFNSVIDGSFSGFIQKDISMYKPNTTYTAIVNIKSNTTTVNIMSLGRLGAPFSILSEHVLIAEPQQTGLYVFKFVTREFIDDSLKGFNIICNGKYTGQCTINNVVILEGDHTQNPPSFFEGLKSVGQDDIAITTTNAPMFFGKGGKK